MQPNPFLTALKILAFVVLAFLVGVSSCQKANLEDKIEALTASEKGLASSVDELANAIRRGGVRGAESRHHEVVAVASRLV